MLLVLPAAQHASDVDARQGVCGRGVCQEVRVHRLASISLRASMLGGALYCYAARCLRAWAE